MTDDGNWIARCGESHIIPEQEQLANAHLIAAAPKMLEALKEVLGYHDKADCLTGRLSRLVAAAISKAEGRS